MKKKGSNKKIRKKIVIGSTVLGIFLSNIFLNEYFCKNIKNEKNNNIFFCEKIYAKDSNNKKNKKNSHKIEETVYSEGENDNNNNKWPSGIEIETPNAIVMDVNTGTILYEKNINERRYPASITKILTTLLAVENCNLSENVTFSREAVYKNEINASHIARDEGEVITMEQCLYATMLESANECAYATAEHVGSKKGGDYTTFIDLMNKRAQKLGCKDTHFNNSNGMPDEQHYTTAYDMALIAKEAYQNENFRKIMLTKKYTLPATNKHPEETYLRNHHMMYYPKKTTKYLYDGCLGGKTGYTIAANATLVTYAKRNDMLLCCVVLNAKSPNHYLDTIKLFDYCFDNFKILNVKDYEKKLKYKGKKVKYDLNSYINVPKTVDYKEVTSKFIKNNSKVELEYSYLGRKVGAIQIVQPKEKIKKAKTVNSNDNDDIIKWIIGAVVIILLTVTFRKMLAKKKNIIFED
ncbi:D-alanyl-D-alanine carboxypeptidase family protein [Lachnobacterium bovis]|nr:D-alanyl-D-alanine carboxypeptidase family protein [Lachnobacterium bovis]